MRVPYDGCPLCGGKQSSLINETDCTQHALYQPDLPATMKWLKCETCEHVYTDGYWSDEALKLIFAGVSDPVQWFNPATMEHERHVAARIVDRVMAHRGATGPDDRWLDIGCGNGALLFTAAEYGFTPVGIDMRKATVDALSPIGLEVYHCEFGERVGRAALLLADAPVTVISMADVLEHLPLPQRALREANHMLARGSGLLFISCPAADSPVWDMLDAAGVNPYWQEIEHYHNFSRERLFALLRDAGFEPLSYGVSERYRIGMEIVARAI
mgnify:FL=1